MFNFFGWEGKRNWANSRPTGIRGNAQLLMGIVVICGLLGVQQVGRRGLVPTDPYRTPIELYILNAAPVSRSAPRRPRGARLDQSNAAASYARFSSDLQDSSSITQQQRKCRDKAQENGHDIPADLEFADEAVSGTKRDRDGLNAMLAAARAGRFGTLYFESLSRLAREFVITMPVLKELVYVDRVRVISVSEGIDSTNGNWELMAIFRAWMHEEFLKALRTAVLRGQEEAVLNDFSVGDWCFGYGSEPIPGSDDHRKSRHPKPRKRYIINEEHARWVRLIFHWFVQERQSLDWIARELTRRQAPKDHRATRPNWHHDYVKRVLRNRKYVGVWPWGRKTNVRHPLTGQVWQEDRPIEEAVRWERERPQLRIIDDDTFFRAQALLDEFDAKFNASRREKGRLAGSAAGAGQPRHLLQGLVKCGHGEQCGCTFQVNGACGKYLGCSGYKAGSCSCKTRLPRKLAERLILQAIGERMLADPNWRQAVLAETQAAVERQQRSSPNEKKEVEQALAAAKQKKQRLIDALEGGTIDADVQTRLAQRNQECLELQRRLDGLKRSEDVPTQSPTSEWVEEQLKKLHQVLTGESPAAALALRELIGSIVVTEVERPGHKRKFLRGTFTLKSAGLAHTSGLTTGSGTAASLTTEEIVLDFVEQPRWAAVADKVKEMFDVGVSNEQIAARVPCRFSWVAKALVWWHRQRGLTAPDGRSVRKRLVKPKLAEDLADHAKALWDQDYLMQEIARQLKCSKDTVTQAIAYWFHSRGLEVPDGRSRRKELPRKRAPKEGSAGPPGSSADNRPAR